MPKQRVRKGIFGVSRGKRPITFSFSPVNGDEWPSDDSDSDYGPERRDVEETDTDEDKRNRRKTKHKHKKLKRRKRVTKEDSKEAGEPKRSCPCSKKQLDITQERWNNMPIIIVERIFHFVLQERGQFPTLFRLSSVCRLWREAAKAAFLWKNVNLNKTMCQFREKKQFEALQYVLDNFSSHVETLDLTNWETLHMNTFANITLKCVNLSRINLSGCVRLNSIAIGHLAQNCSKLKAVDFTGIAYPNNKPQWIPALDNFMLEKASVLEELVLSRNYIGQYSFLTKHLVPNGLPSLKLLDFSNCICSTSHHILDIDGLQRACPQLEILRLVGHNFSLPTSTIRLVSPGFPNLQQLSMAQYRETCRSTVVQNEILTRILKNAIHLKLLDLRGQKYIGHSALMDLCCNDVEYLYLCGCSETLNVQEVAEKWGHSLIELDLSASKAFPQGPKFTICCAATKLTKIQTIDLCGTDVSEEDIKPVLEKCLTLKTLRLDRCRRLSRGMKQTFNVDRLEEFRGKLCSNGTK